MPKRARDADTTAFNLGIVDRVSRQKYNVGVGSEELIQAVGMYMVVTSRKLTMGWKALALIAIYFEKLKWRKLERDLWMDLDEHPDTVY